MLSETPDFMNNSFKNKQLNNEKNSDLDWKLIQSEMKNKLGIDIYESWLKKIGFVEEFNNYLLLSVPTRFIRDWITSRYLDQILKVIKSYKKELIRIEFKIIENIKEKNNKDNHLNLVEKRKYNFYKRLLSSI